MFVMKSDVESITINIYLYVIVSKMSVQQFNNITI